MALLAVAHVPSGFGRPCRQQPATSRTLGARPIRCSGGRGALLKAAAIILAGAAPSKAEGIALPLNYAELLGLQGVQLPLQPAVEKAYDDLINTPLEAGFSELARVGKEKLLFAARDGLRGVRGRTALLSATVPVEPLLLPGAMALLHQVKRYDLVIQLSEEGAALGARDIRNASRDTMKEFEQDMALATALAQCGLADRALRDRKPALACARLQEALHLLTDAPSAGSSPQPAGRGANGQAAGQRQLAPRLQGDIRAALAEYHPDAVADYLQVPLDRADGQLRANEVGALRQWVSTPAEALRRDQSPILTPEYMARIVPRLTSGELCGLYPWEQLAAGGSSGRCPWYYPGLLKLVALAHLVAGFVERRPLLVKTALKLFGTLKKDDDVAVPLAMCQLLLGDAAGALAVLEEDDRAQQHLRQQQPAAERSPVPLPAAAAAAGSNGASGATVSSAVAGPEGRHAVMQFIRAQSPQGEADLRPGLAQFASWWLGTVAYPEFQDTALGTTPGPDLAAYFEDVRVQAFLDSEDGQPSSRVMGLLSRLADLRAALLARFAALAAAVGEFISSCRGHLEQRRQQAWHLLPSRLLTASTVQWLAGVAALATALVYAASLQGIGVGGRLPWLQPQATADAVAMAADIGLPPAALRPLQPAHTEQAAMQARELLQQKKQQQKAAAQLLLLQQQQQQEAAAQLLQQQQQAAAAQLIQQQQAAAELAAAQQRQQQQQQQRVAVLSKSTASRIVKEWLGIKVEAMGPRHHTERLSQVLEEPMLTAVLTEAGEAAESGWFWNIRPLKSRVDSVDASAFTPADGSGHVRVLATVDESADLFASNGKQGDSYKTTYQVEYTMVPAPGGSSGWKIAAALVLGK